MKKLIVFLGIALCLCLNGSALALDIDTDSNDAVDIVYGGTNATSAGAALTNLGAESETHAADHSGQASGADAFAPGSSTGLLPNQTVCNEGTVFSGNGSNVGQCTSTIPNLAISAFPATDDTWSGIAISGTAGYATAQWDVVFLDSVSDNNKFEKADANESGDFPAWGLATAAVAEDAALVVIVKGCIRNDGWNGSFTHGDLLYLDETTAGGLVASASAPDTSGDCVQPIGYFFDKGTDTYLCIDVNPVSGWATVP